MASALEPAAELPSGEKIALGDETAAAHGHILNLLATTMTLLELFMLIKKWYQARQAAGTLPNLLNPSKWNKPPRSPLTVVAPRYRLPFTKLRVPEWHLSNVKDSKESAFIGMGIMMLLGFIGLVVLFQILKFPVKLLFGAIRIWEAHWNAAKIARRQSQAALAAIPIVTAPPISAASATQAAPPPQPAPQASSHAPQAPAAGHGNDAHGGGHGHGTHPLLKILALGLAGLGAVWLISSAVGMYHNNLQTVAPESPQATPAVTQAPTPVMPQTAPQSTPTASTDTGAIAPAILPGSDITCNGPVCRMGFVGPFITGIPATSQAGWKNIQIPDGERVHMEMMNILRAQCHMKGEDPGMWHDVDDTADCSGDMVRILGAFTAGTNLKYTYTR